MSEQAKEIALFVQEDDPQTMDHLLDIVARIGLTMEVTTCFSSRHLADTEYMLEVDPALEGFTHLLFDLDVEHYSRRRNGKLVEYGTRTKYAGLDYILDAYDHLPGFREKVKTKRVAIFSAHSIDFLEQDCGSTGKAVHEHCHYISKLSKSLGDKILRWLGEG